MSEKIPIFEASNTTKNMKKCFTLVLLTTLLSGLCACQDRQSKAFKSMQQEMADLERLINETNDCDDLQMLNFSILGLRTDLANLIEGGQLKESEAEQLSDLIDRTDRLWENKTDAKGCQQADLDDAELDTSGEEDAGNYPD